MKIGIDGRKMPGAEYGDPVTCVLRAAELGMQGVFFRTVLDMTDTLDPGILRDAAEAAAERGMYLEAGLGKVNPCANPETPEVRRIGDGDTVEGFRRMIAAAAAIGITELWASTGGAKHYRSRFRTDRFRTDVDWRDQLMLTARFLDRLAPIARDHGVHINLETHEEISTFEITRLVDAHPDCLGVVYDPANPFFLGEHPERALARVAPYVRQTHLRDVYLERTSEGVLHRTLPLGSGVLNVDAITDELVRHPAINLTFENEGPRSERSPLSGVSIPGGSPSLIESDSPEWRAAHPDLTSEEFDEFLAIVDAFTERVHAGEVPSWQERASEPFELPEAKEWIASSTRHLRDALSRAQERIS